MVEVNVLADGGKKMKFRNFDGYMRGLGTVRVDGQSYGSYDLAHAGDMMLESNKIRPFICGPIRVYSRGPNDLRLEYDFKVHEHEADDHSQRLHGQVKNVILKTLKIKGRWNHSHWLGIELVS